MSFSQPATARPFSPRVETVMPKKIVNTISARIWFLEMTSEKSPTVNVLTI